MNWIETIRQVTRSLASQATQRATHLAEDLPLLADFSQMNRRTRRALRSGRITRATYLFAGHQRRRLARRQEIRALIGE